MAEFPTVRIKKSKPRKKRPVSTKVVRKTKTTKGWNRGPVYIKETETTEERSEPTDK